MSELRTDFKDDVLDVTQNEKRKYRIIHNDDGTISLEDATVYLQKGDSFGANDINEMNEITNQMLGVNEKLDGFTQHTTKEVTSEEGVHGIRYYNDTIEVEQDGEYKDSLSHLVKIENSKLEGNVKITPNNSNELSVVCGEGLTHPTIYIHDIINQNIGKTIWRNAFLNFQGARTIGNVLIPTGYTWLVWTSKNYYTEEFDTWVGKKIYISFKSTQSPVGTFMACAEIESVGTKNSVNGYSDGVYMQLINDETVLGLFTGTPNTTILGIYTDLETETFNNYNVFGNNLSAQNHQMLIGHYNNATLSTSGVSSGTSDGTAFCIGNGTKSAVSNALRVNYNGTIYAKSSTVSTGADYSEYFEWLDGNEDNEDRVGYFVTFDEKQKIRKANATDDYILGIVSGLPCIIGNGDEDWRGRYILDEFGRFIEETFEYEETVINSETGEEETVTRIGTKYKENPEYDSNKEYIERAKRKEWSAVGMIGVLSVYDDGTCQENGYCTVSDGGIATACEYSNVKAYRVLERVTDNIVKVLFK